MDDRHFFLTYKSSKHTRPTTTIQSQSVLYYTSEFLYLSLIDWQVLEQSTVVTFSSL